jgi:hypothetical protein
MSMSWLFEATTDNVVYCFSVFRWPHNSDSPTEFLICCRSRGPKHLYPVLDGVAIRNHSMSPKVKCRLNIFCLTITVSLLFKTSLRRTRGLQLTIDPCLPNGVPTWTLQHNLSRLLPPGPPEYICWFINTFVHVFWYVKVFGFFVCTSYSKWDINPSQDLRCLFSDLSFGSSSYILIFNLTDCGLFEDNIVC